MGKATKRGKKDSSNNNDNDSNKVTLQDELNRAEAAIRQSQIKVNAIHKQWKTYLVRLAFMVLMITMHQMRSPTSACLKDVKHYNQAVEKFLATGSGSMPPELESENGDHIISGYQATLLVLSDSMVHLLAVVMAACLSFFLQQVQKAQDDLTNLAKQANREQYEKDLKQPKLTFANPRYLISNACIPPMMALYFGQQKTTNADETISCLQPQFLEWAQVAPEERQRSLPIVLVFHVICTACLWFMEFQQGQVIDNLKKVEQLRAELAQAQTKNEVVKAQHAQTQQRQQQQEASQSSPANKKEQ